MPLLALEMSSSVQGLRLKPDYYITLSPGFIGNPFGLHTMILGSSLRIILLNTSPRDNPHFFDSNTRSPPSTNPLSLPMCNTISHLPFPLGFFIPVDSPERNACFFVFTVLSLHDFDVMWPSFTQVSSR